jgi:hypothetical protein
LSSKKVRNKQTTNYSLNSHIIRAIENSSGLSLVGNGEHGKPLEDEEGKPSYF